MAMISFSRHPSLRSIKLLLAVLVVLFGVVWLAPPISGFEGLARYDSIHITVETLSIVISMLVFGVAWNAYSRERSSNSIILACGLLATGLLDFAHMMSYAGMPQWVTPSGPEKAINFWLAARLVFAVSLLAVALRPWLPFRRPATRYRLLAAAIAFSAFSYWVGLYHENMLPHTFIPGHGLTHFKIDSEYFITIVLAASAGLFWRQAQQSSPVPEAAGLFAAAAITILSELSFTLYSDVTDIFNLLGHFYKVLAYLLVYRTIFVGSVHEPFRRVLAAEAAQHRLNRTLQTLSSCNHALVHAAVEDELLQNMCRNIVEVGGHLLSWIGYARQDEAKSIEPVASHAVRPGYVDSLHVSWDDTPSGQGPSGMAVRSGKTRIAQHIASDPHMAAWRDQALAYGYQASIALPLRMKGATMGVLTIYAGEPNAFDTAEVALLEELAEDISFGIASLRLRGERDHAVAERQHALENMSNVLEDTVQAIAATLEMRDPYTAGHQRRVADLAAAIGKEMGLPPERIFVLHLAGAVHDIGKISIPAEILSKPGRLSDIEYSLIKQHPQAGYDILKGVDFPWPLAKFVLQHHERLDGSGYPVGLAGEEILQEARIIAVADVVEAMSSHRPYRAGLGLEKALAEIEGGRGILYDSAIVDATQRLFHEQNYQFEKHS